MSDQCHPEVPRARWKLGQRVLVHEVGTHGQTEALSKPAPGSVCRLLMRNGDEAWVRLDKRLEGADDRLNAFPADDSRSRDVPTDRFVCEVAP